MAIELVTFVPFDLEANLGRAYNHAMALLPPDAWAVLFDHDAMPTTREWYRQITEVIEHRPDVGLLTATTNRIASPWQRAAESDLNNHDMAYHRKLGAARLERRTLLDVTDTKGLGGVLMVLSRRTWERVGGFVDGMLCVDHMMHFAVARAGLRVYVVDSLYVYHWRRAHGDELPASVPKAKRCPCRGPEPTPTRRIPIVPEGATNETR
jgi:GT2 family glycosyltransferase